MQNSFHKSAKITLILVYLVIAAGAIVRMTGSGMGCPDWPKCFGYYIPPTEASQLEWAPKKAYEEGQVIIRNESLKVAKSDFISPLQYADENWEPYSKHEYAIFNPWHTWIEFINRLLGALAGLATLVLAYISLRYWKKNRAVTILSVLTVLAMGFQAWLGATVVYSVLEPVKITIHMVMALVIVAMLLYLIHRTKERKIESKKSNSIYLWLSLAVGITLVQVILGTQVRQFVDEQIDLVGEVAKDRWLENPTLQFYVHRSFSIAVVLLNVFIAFKIRKENLGFTKIDWVLGILLLEVLSGVIMYYFDFPFSSQPVHLILASLLFGTQFYLVLEALHAKRSHKTL
ncbi:heme A synthase [Aggregatimonas sangjinii]|uniref:Heme A synthase n=1 Tax=Aggregatimonas sangjinii TaxID=2583587 RepID=A0A5B7SUL2_9FLAO|nr:COX15/CtaA family protein [Aggregatimonas sangjinii]QCX02276.1 heme A synthase [Aggregatimonas sangjinii]